MSTLHSSEPVMRRIATSLKVGVMLVLLGLLVVATERPTLFSPAVAVTTAEAAHLIDQDRASAEVKAATSADEFAYFPSQFRAPSGPVEDLPPQF